jgi:hypothetical protein
MLEHVCSYGRTDEGRMALKVYLSKLQFFMLEPTDSEKILMIKTWLKPSVNRAAFCTIRFNYRSLKLIVTWQLIFRFQCRVGNLFAGAVVTTKDG